MQAVLMVAHGSKDKEAIEEVYAFMDALETKLDSHIMIGTCFLEFAKPDIPEGIAALVAKGARKIAVIPMMLLQAGHSKIHIPNELDEAKEKYPHVRFTYGRPIGIHDVALEICRERVEEIGENTAIPAPDTALLLVGRGGSDRDANSDLYKIARLLWEKLNFGMVEPAFMGVTTPLVEAGVECCMKLGAKRIIVLPYFLFTGILIKRLEKMIGSYGEKYPGIQFKLADYLGLHPHFQTIFLERIEEALNEEARMNCDTCAYRFEAGRLFAHHHHHHDEHDESHSHHGHHNEGHRHHKQDVHDKSHHHHHSHYGKSHHYHHHEEESGK